MRVKNISFFPVSRTLAVVALLCIVVVSSYTAHAYTAEQYQTDKQFMPGSLVALDDKGQFGLTDASSNRYTGIVARQIDSSFDLVSSGVVHVLVSDIDGDITSGNRIGLSSLQGVGSKLLAGRQDIGVALEQLSSASLGWEAITTEGRTFHIARIPVQLDHGGQAQSGSAVTSLQRFAEKLLNKPVAAWRVIAALTVGLGGVLLAFFLVISASREAFASLGRNPLASPAILNSLWKIVAVALAIVFTSLLISYLIASTG